MKTIEWFIRSAWLDDASDIARVEVETWRDTYRNLLPDWYLKDLSYMRREISWRELIGAAPRRGYPFVAIHEDKVVGFILGGTERYGRVDFPTECYALYVQPGFQKLGIGRGLLGRLALQFTAEGYTSMLVRVLKDNPAMQFYQAMGGEYLGSRPDMLGRLQIVVLEYGWRNFKPLLPAENEKL